MGFADIAQGLTKVAEGFVTLAEKVVQFAGDFLRFVRRIVAVGSRVLGDIADWAAENLFRLDLLELNGRLDSDFNACVRLKVQCVIVGMNIDYDGKSFKSRLYALYPDVYAIYDPVDFVSERKTLKQKYINSF